MQQDYPRHPQTWRQKRHIKLSIRKRRIKVTKEWKSARNHLKMSIRFKWAGLYWSERRNLTAVQEFLSSSLLLIQVVDFLLVSFYRSVITRWATSELESFRPKWVRENEERSRLSEKKTFFFWGMGVFVSQSCLYLQFCLAWKQPPININKG